jgi:hypothetical protein
MATKAHQVRKAIFSVRPEWKSLKRISVQCEWDYINVSLLIGLLDSEATNAFNCHGTLMHNHELIRQELEDVLGVNVITTCPVSHEGREQRIVYKTITHL